METNFYPVITIETEEELETIKAYCDENKIEFQFLDNQQNSFPSQVLLLVDSDDFNMFLDDTH
jgi:hypothetical protein